MNNDYRQRCRAPFQVSADLKNLDAAELIREALEARLRMRQAVQELEEAYGYLPESTCQKLNALAAMFATTDGLDEVAMSSILAGIQRRGEPNPRPSGRLLGL